MFSEEDINTHENSLNKHFESVILNLKYFLLAAKTLIL